MGINNPLDNINNAGWNLPSKPPVYQSPFSDIDTFLNTSVQYASNTINNNMGLNLTTVDKLKNNQSLDTQNLFSLMGAGQTVGYNNNGIFRNTIDSFTSKDATTVLPTDKPINSEVKTGELTMEQLFARTTEQSKTSTNTTLTVEQILKNYPNAIAGPTGAVFGRSINILGLPEAATQTTDPAFLSDLSGLSKEKAAALLTIANQYPELAKNYLQDTANKAQQINTPMANAATNQTTTGINFTGMPSGFNQLYNASVQPLGQLNQADTAQKAETMKLISDALKLTSQDVQKN